MPVGFAANPSRWFSANTPGFRSRRIRRSPSKGKSRPTKQKREGPYGEWTGYYASGERTEPIMKVKRMMHRNNPILTGAPSSRPPAVPTTSSCAPRSFGILWKKPASRTFTGVACFQGTILYRRAIKQRYPGHAKQAGMIAAQCGAGAYLGRMSSSSMTTSTLRYERRDLGDVHPGRIPRTTRTLSAAPGAAPSTQSYRKTKKASAPAPSSTPHVPMNG